MAATVFKEYGDASTKALEAIYDAVQKNFTSYYSFVNRDDEEKFEGKLTPSVGKLAFDVDFYGRGKFPPGAYHSEGHQDAMGLCLYLALMNHTLGNDFVLAVLDHVLMSVDADHRREVCELLKKFFPNTQFILTTHDPVWLQFMNSQKLIKGSTNFGGWSVDTGPQVWREDLVNVPYLGSATVLNYTSTGTQSGTNIGTLTVTNSGTQVASIALLGNYIAGSADFVASAGAGGSGTIITDPPVTDAAEQQSFFAQPRHG